MKIEESVKRVYNKLYSKRIQFRLKSNYQVYVKKPLYMVGDKYISTGMFFKAAEGVRIEAWDKHGRETYNPRIVIGENAFLNVGTHISAIQELTIGDNFLTGSYVSIIDNNHGQSNTYEEMIIPPAERKLFSKGPISIGNNVWIGDKACVFGGVSIGDGAIIGANAVVTHSIPSYCIAVGNPARVISRIMEVDSE